MGPAWSIVDSKALAPCIALHVCAVHCATRLSHHPLERWGSKGLSMPTCVRFYRFYMSVHCAPPHHCRAVGEAAAPASPPRARAHPKRRSAAGWGCARRGEAGRHAAGRQAGKQGLPQHGRRLKSGRRLGGGGRGEPAHRRGSCGGCCRACPRPPPLPQRLSAHHEASAGAPASAPRLLVMSAERASGNSTCAGVRAAEQDRPGGPERGGQRATGYQPTAA